ncbi:MAG: (Fe-S)-binding protein, partial [Mizugakiibacter sp.]|uniref:(Fe-S)-binding protein n=1 Tax=Mizugakiibacter sp. TaxID=1972610 RepID=UPI003210C6BC
TAGARAAEVRALWQAAGAQRLVNATPGCLGTLREALPGVAAEDALTLLDRAGAALRFRPLAERVAVHLPCTAVNVARSDGATLRLLARVPGLEILPLPAEPGCCGAAGSHLLEFPQRAAALRATKLDQAAALAPRRLLSGNIGCRLHLEAGLRERGAALPVEHPLTLLARQLESP